MKGVSCIIIYELFRNKEVSSMIHNVLFQSCIISCVR